MQNEDRDDDEEPKSKKNRVSLPLATNMMLKTWLLQHYHNPYPSDDEKRSLIKECGLSLRQLQNWFINARRRLVKAKASDCRRVLLREQSRLTTAKDYYALALKEVVDQMVRDLDKVRASYNTKCYQLVHSRTYPVALRRAGQEVITVPPEPHMRSGDTTDDESEPTEVNDGADVVLSQQFDGHHATNHAADTEPHANKRLAVPAAPAAPVAVWASDPIINRDRNSRVTKVQPGVWNHVAVRLSTYLQRQGSAEQIYKAICNTGLLERLLLEAMKVMP